MPTTSSKPSTTPAAAAGAFGFLRTPWLALCCAALLDCQGEDDSPNLLEARSGGQTSVAVSNPHAFSLPAANLSAEQRLDFNVGKSFFRNPWVSAPSTTLARDGLGPLFNGNACQNCHLNNGPGLPADAQYPHSLAMLLRLSVPADGSPAQTQALQQFGAVPDPIYGLQLQNMALPGLAAEGKFTLNWTEQRVTLADGMQLSLRSPHLKVTSLGYGPLTATQFSLRVGPSMIGLGLLEAIDEADILSGQDPHDSNGDGIYGVANWVMDHSTGQLRLGRFGWKAGEPSIAQQNAQAFAADLGLSNPIFAQDECSKAQPTCRNAPQGGHPEVPEPIFKQVLFYTQHLAVPNRRNLGDPQVQQGAQLFVQAGCSSCHRPHFVTSKQAASPALASQSIWPFSDLLLHDMGAELADNRPEFKASGRHWRTAPLWGLGLRSTVSGHTRLLHDGRARSVLEAILWHTGEAQKAKQAVMLFSASERQALLAFLHSL